jgi:hypothetical protein
MKVDDVCRIGMDVLDVLDGSQVFSVCHVLQPSLIFASLLVARKLWNKLCKKCPYNYKLESMC